MNERIRELWAQCVIKHTKTPMNWQDAADEFAQLIVQECIAQCEKNVDHEYLGWGSKLSACNIKHHFGVEE